MYNKKESRPATTGTAITKEVFGTNPRKHSITPKSKKQVLFAFFVSILIVVTIWAVADANTTEFEPIEHKVTYGDTLWTIAQQYKPDNMTMDRYMAWVYEHNDGDIIYPGDVVIMAEVVR